MSTPAPLSQLDQTTQTDHLALDYTPRQRELIKILQEVYTLLDYHTPTQDYFTNNPAYPSKHTFEQEFNGWNNALGAAELPLNRIIPVHSHKQLISQIRYKCAQLGRTVLQSEMDEDPTTASADTFIRAFGPWEQVLATSGFSVNWSTPEFRQRANAALWRLYIALEYEEPTMFNIQNSTDPDLPCMVVITNVFGGLIDFLVASGVRTDYNRRERAKLIELYTRLATELGHPPYEHDPRIPHSKVRRFFGSHNAVIKAAHLLTNREQRTRKQLIQDLQRQYRTTHKTPTHESIDTDPTMAAASTYRREFGDLTTALNEAKIPLGIHRRGYGDDVLDAQLRIKVSQIRRIPTQREIDSDPAMACSPTFVRNYGGW